MFRIIVLSSLTIFLLAIASLRPESGLTSDSNQQAGFGQKSLSTGVSNTIGISASDFDNQRAPTASNNEQLALVSATDHLPIEESEFYYPGMTQEGVGAVREPRWAMELEARGITGTNVLKANRSGVAPVPRIDSDAEFVFGVGVALTKKNSAVQIKLVAGSGQVIRTLSLSSPQNLFWRANLGKFISGSNDSPGRLEVTVLRGKAQAFLSIMDVNTSQIRLLTVVPRGNNSRNGEIHTATTRGTGYFTHGILDCPGSSYAYEINDGPPNSCGELHIVRNGVSQVTSCWTFTDGGGHALMGPWTVSTNQTGTSIYIQWPDGSTTTGDDYKIDDNSPPSVQIDTCGSSVIEGSASDAQWGVGFNGSSVLASFRQTYYPYKYWDGSGYNSYSEYFFFCSISPFFGGYNINWSIVPPPSAGTTQVHVTASDICNEANAYCTY